MNRIFGTESEYALVYRPRESGSQSAPHVEKLLDHQERISALLLSAMGTLGVPAAGEFLGNGGRLYGDRGGHPEYATPECRSVSELVAHEIAGDRLVRDLTEIVNTRQESLRLHIYKNNVDFHGHTYGGHENYLVTPQGLSAISRLLPFLVTRQIYAGSGKVMTVRQDGEFGFQIGQRADFFDCTYSDRTSGVRGIINIRKREITRSDQSRRLHLIIGDSNMSPYAIGLKIGTLALMLRVLEAGGPNDDLELDAPAAALKAISRDIHANVAARRHGRHITCSAIEIQSICLENALQFYAANPPDPEETAWLRHWEHVLCGLRQLKIRQPEMVLERDPADLRRKIDWILKLWLLDRSRSKGADESRLKTLDIVYHDLNPATGAFERCLSLDMVERLISETDIGNARIDPPQGTRARLRGMIVKTAFGKNVTVDVENWERIRVRARLDSREAKHCFHRFKRDVNRMDICLDDPFMAEHPKIMEDLKNFIAKSGEYNVVEC